MGKKSEIQAVLEKIVGEKLRERQGAVSRSFEDILADSSPNHALKQSQPGAGVARIVRALTAAKGDPDRA